MSLHTYLERLRYTDDLIRRKATGDLKQLSKKLNLSKSQTVRFINEMRNCGFPVEYSRKVGCYFYSESGRLVDNLFWKNSGRDQDLSEDDMRRITGGSSLQIDFPDVRYMSCSTAIGRDMVDGRL